MYQNNCKYVSSLPGHLAWLEVTKKSLKINKAVIGGVGAFVLARSNLQKL